MDIIEKLKRIQDFQSEIEAYAQDLRDGNLENLAKEQGRILEEIQSFLRDKGGLSFSMSGDRTTPPSVPQAIAEKGE